IGGYVKMYGDDPAGTVPEDQKPYAFLHKPIYQRFAIVLAGPLMNLFFAMLIYAFIAGVGEEVPGPYAGDIAPDTKAFAAGLRSGDKIIKVGEIETPTWSDLQKAVEDSGGQKVSLRIERKGEAQPLNLEVPVVYADNENIFSSRAQVG